MLIVGAAVAVWLGLTFKPVVENDGVFYFAYLHAIVVQHDLDFTNEYRAAAAAGVHYEPQLITTTNAAGIPSNAYPVGPAVLSVPFYAVALALAGPSRPQFGPPYTTAFCLASLLAGLLTLALGFRLALRLTSTVSSSAIGVATAALTTPFIYYLSFEPSYSHTFSALASTAFVLWWWRTGGRRSSREWLVLGVLGGVMGMTRFQDGAIAAIALLDLRHAGWRYLWMVPGMVIGFAPQLWVDYSQFGTWLPYRPANLALQPFPGHYLSALFSSDHGLFSWHPSLLLAALGMGFMRDRKLQLAFVIAFVLETLIVGSAPDWDGGFSFGGRRYLVLMPFFIMGFAALALRLSTQVALWTVALLTAWNIALMANLTYLIADRYDPGYLRLFGGQLKALLYVPREFVQGHAVRALVLWPVLHEAPKPVGGLTLLTLEAVCVLASMATAGGRQFWSGWERVRAVAAPNRSASA